MKSVKILFILLAVSLAGCVSEEVNFEGSSVAFYPTRVIEALEEDGQTYTVNVKATGPIPDGSQVQISFDNYEFLTTVPEHTDGVLILDLPSSGEAAFSVQADDDNVPNDYVATFRVTAVGAEFDAIVDSDFKFVVEDDDVGVLMSEDFNQENLDEWTVVTAVGNNWGTRSFNGNGYANVSNYQADSSSSWLISPLIEFSETDKENLSFESQAQFNSEANKLNVFILTNYTLGEDPNSDNVVKTLLSVELDEHEAPGFGDFTASGNIDLTNISEDGYLAFQYNSLNSNDGSGWSVDNVVISYFDPEASDGIPNDSDDNEEEPEDEEPEDDGDTADGGCATDELDRPSISVPFNDDFESCSTQGEHNIPTNWFEENVPGTKTDRGWGCRERGVDDSWSPRASAYGGDEGRDDAWLISNGKFNLTELTSVTLGFSVESRYSGAGSLTVLWSTDYMGQGDPTCATWTTLEDASAAIEGLTSEEFTAVSADLSAAGGEHIYLAFRYLDGTSDASVAYTIDNLSITGN